MTKKFSEQEKAGIISLYSSGKPATEIVTEFGVPRSTLYYWVKGYRSIKSSTPETVTYKEYQNLQRRIAKLEERLAVIHAAGCCPSAPLKEKLTALEKLYGQYSVHALCEALDVARGTFYNHIFRRKEVTAQDKRREEMRVHIRNAFDESQQRYGGHKVSTVLTASGIKASPKYVAELMREMNLRSVNTTSKKDYQRQLQYAKRENVLQQKFHVTAPNFVWVSDVTCFKVNDRYIYVCVIIDLFSRKVISYGISWKNSTYLLTTTFRRAFNERGKPTGLTFHSDQGAQYTSNTFRKLLRMNNIVQSFSHSGRPQDNAVSEAFFASLKKEEVYRRNYNSENEFRKSIDTYMHFYNTERPHRTLHYKAPEQFELEYAK